MSSVASLLAIFVLAVVSATYLAVGIAGLKPFSDPIRADIVLPDSANLAVHSPVLLFGVKMGEVESIDTTRDGVRVRFALDEGSRIPMSSTVIVESLSALSEAYIEFRADSLAGPYIHQGQTIRGSSVRTAKSIPEVAATMTSLLRQFDPKTFSSLVTTFSKALTGTDAVIPQLAHASDLLAATLIAREPQLRALMVSAQKPGAEVGEAGRQLEAAGPEFVRFGVEVQKVVQGLADLLHARQPLSVYREGNGLVPFLNKVSGFIDTIGPDLQTLYPVLGPLIQAAGDAVAPLDISALITQALNSVSPDGKIRLTIAVK